MNTTVFPQVERGSSGYDPTEVDAFLEAAKNAYEGKGVPIAMSSAKIRAQAFTLVPAGYSTAHVDAALERLEDVFSAREKQHAVAALGSEAWFSEAKETAQIIVNRLGRSPGHRFRRVNLWTPGYHRADVDAFTDKVMRYFTEGWPISVPDVRSAVFREQRGGYREEQVDFVLDAVVDVMLAVRP